MAAAAAGAHAGARVPMGNGIFFDPSVPINALLPDEGNPNHMPEAKYRQLVANIRDSRIGLVQPVLLRPELDAEGKETGRYFIVDGHHRVLAAKECGYTTVPGVLREGLTREVAKLLGLGMNNIHGEPDLAAVADIFKDLVVHGITVDEMVISGYDKDSILKVVNFQPVSPDTPSAPTGETPNAEAKIHTLEVVFGSEQDMKRVKSKIDKAAKKLGIKDKGLALMSLLTMDAAATKTG